MAVRMAVGMAVLDAFWLFTRVLEDHVDLYCLILEIQSFQRLDGTYQLTKTSKL